MGLPDKTMMFQFTVKLPEAEALDGSSASSYGL